MSRITFVRIPAVDLRASIVFHLALGFQQNSRFCDDGFRSAIRLAGGHGRRCAVEQCQAQLGTTARAGRLRLSLLARRMLASNGSPTFATPQLSSGPAPRLQMDGPAQRKGGQQEDRPESACETQQIMFQRARNGCGCAQTDFGALNSRAITAANQLALHVMVHLVVIRYQCGYGQPTLSANRKWVHVRASFHHLAEQVGHRCASPRSSKDQWENLNR
jgi:hypothetical protein